MLSPHPPQCVAFSELPGVSEVQMKIGKKQVGRPPSYLPHSRTVWGKLIYVPGALCTASGLLHNWVVFYFFPTG